MKGYFLIMLLAMASASVRPDVIGIAVHTDNEIDRLSHSEVYDIFLFQNDVWANGEPIRVLTLPLNSIEHRIFLDKYTGLNYLGYTRRYNNRINSGRGKPPIIVKNYREMLDKIAADAGAIGYTQETVREFMQSHGIKVVEVY